MKKSTKYKFQYSNFFTVSSLSATIKLIGIAFEFILNIILARLLGAEQFGLYCYTIVLISSGALIATLGYDTSSLRYIPKYNISNDLLSLHSFVRTSVFHTFTASITILIIYYTLSTTIFSNNKISPIIIISLPLLPILSLSRVRQSILRSLKYTVRSEILDITIRPLLYITILAIITIVNKYPINAKLAIIANLIISFLIFIAGYYWLYFRIPKNNQLLKEKYIDNRWIRVSISLLLLSALQLISGYTDLLMLGFLSDYTSSGIYSAAIKIASFASFGLLAINMLLAPIISELFSANKLSELQKIIRTATKAASFISIFISMFLLIFGRTLLYLFGPQFNTAYLPLIILLPGQLINSFCGSVGFLLSLTGYHNYTFKILLISTSLNIIFNFILIPLFGMTGAAISTTVSTATWNILMAFYVYKKLDIQPTILRLKNA